ncbi:MAG: 4-hydroxy-tetrahydrodipicolinate reductase [Syntrophomonadaceae bacterium]|jgi:4-hydroxy-tetrahydrodipicolinate reductase|nr:4-hydroxy-tetrahydrodipicolinate reductase [Syntrophomonadaceae bacterium]
MAEKIKVAVAGALGRMGQETVKAVAGDEDLELVGAVDVQARGQKLSEVVGLSGLDLDVVDDLATLIQARRPDVIVDFTNAQAVFDNVRTTVGQGLTSVVGSSGLNQVEIRELSRLAEEKQTGVAVIPNFAIGAVLMMMFARQAARYLPQAEIIELHHDQKIDAPSGTAIKTAEMINDAIEGLPPRGVQEIEKISGSRGGNLNHVRIHSVRLPGLVAHQEVIFGGAGQSLTIRHDSFNRESFMPGVLLVIKKMHGRKGLVYGLENFL